MQRYFSPSANDGRGAFYSEALHGACVIAGVQTPREIKAGKRAELITNPDCRIPDDAVMVSDARHAELMAAQGEGKAIAAVNGKPMAIMAQVSAAQLETRRRAQRDSLLSASDWTQIDDASPRGGKAAWASYRASLRELDMSGTDWPAAPGQSEGLV